MGTFYRPGTGQTATGLASEVDRAWMGDAISDMTESEKEAFEIILNCLACPFYGSCLTLRRTLRLPLWRLAGVQNPERRIVQECQERQQIAFVQSELAATSPLVYPE